ncbi:MAG: CBS domain-containing protein [Myxococcales bacterium]|nr:CBS domain-containing protein [Myxococcales bacterium]
MTSPALCCSIDDTVDRVAELMWDYEIHAVPVIDVAGRPVGWVTDRSICMAALRTGQPLGSLRVERALLSSVPTVRSETKLSLLERLASRGDASWLLVVDESGGMVGVITDGDVARARLQAPPARSVRRRVASGAGQASPKAPPRHEARRWVGL